MRLPLSPLSGRLAGLLARRRPAQLDHPTAWWAGVAVVLAPDPDALLLIRRATRPGDPWSGHMALPGGRLAPEDPDLLVTAIRESREEVGLTLDPGTLLGQLDDVTPRTPLPNPVIVRPYLFALPDRPTLELSEEVALATWVPLSELNQHGVYREVELVIRGRPGRYPGYQLGDDLVWGLTERIVTPLLELIRQDR